MARLIWRGGFDALIAYQSSASVLVGVVGWLAGCPLRVVHQTCTPAEMPRLLRFLDLIAGTLGLYSANIINSASTWAEYARYPARYRRSMVLIEHGLDAPQPQESRTATRRRFGLPQAQPLLLNVGRVTEQKNQDVLIRALACLPQAHLVIAGAGAKDDAFHELAVTLGIEGRLHMLGALQAQEIADLYAACRSVRVPLDLGNLRPCRGGSRHGRPADGGCRSCRCCAKCSMPAERSLSHSSRRAMSKAGSRPSVPRLRRRPRRRRYRISHARSDANIRGSA